MGEPMSEHEDQYKYKTGRRIFRPFFRLFWFLVIPVWLLLLFIHPFLLFGFIVSLLTGYRREYLKEDWAHMGRDWAKLWEDACTEAEKQLNRFVFLGDLSGE